MNETSKGSVDRHRWRRRRTDDVDEGGRGRMRIRKFQFLLNHSGVKKSREPRLSFNLADTSAKCVYCIGGGGGREREERGWDFWRSPISGWDANLFSTSSRKRRDDWKREGGEMKISATSAKKRMPSPLRLYSRPDVLSSSFYY